MLHSPLASTPIPRRPLVDLEPTSALDPETTLAVEKYTLSMSRRPENTVKVIIWITHSDGSPYERGNTLMVIFHKRVKK